VNGDNAAENRGVLPCSARGGGGERGKARNGEQGPADHHDSPQVRDRKSILALRRERSSLAFGAFVAVQKKVVGREVELKRVYDRSAGDEEPPLATAPKPLAPTPPDSTRR